MKKKSGKNELRPLLAVLLAGTVCALALCSVRIRIESRNTNAIVVMPEASLELIEGELPLVIPFVPGKTIPGPELWLGAGHTFAYADGVTAGLVEDENQYSHIPIDGFVPYNFPAPSFNIPVPLVRVFRLIPEYAARYAVLGYDGAREIENILCRAITDRNIRVIWLEPFVDSRTGEVITDAEVYNETLQNLSARIAAQGLTLGGGFSVFPDHTPNTVLLIGCGFGIVAAGLFLLRSLLKPGKKQEMFLLCLLSAVVAVMLLTAPGSGVRVLSLLSSVIFPCLAFWHLSRQFAPVCGMSAGRVCLRFAAALSAAIGICLLGGLYVAALQSSTRYLLAIDNFRGVKLSQFAPVLYAALILYLKIYKKEGVLRIIKDKKYVALFFVIALCAGIAYFIIRTGDGMVGVGLLEQRFRNWLEYVLPARPRTTEFLVSWPCFAVAFVLFLRRRGDFAWPFAVLISPGTASVVNTFCHSRAPVLLSLVRTVTGAVIGLVIGMAIVFIFARKTDEIKLPPGR
ncbi:MAG: DUF5693 family protein [Oscillospiraceae bacterium]|nr:DUF5693 family protein [Oscillospiraceae bacterium]